MLPVKFPYVNATHVKSGELPLPAYSDGIQTISCWSLTWIERLKVLRSGRIWIRQKNFNQPLQALRPQTRDPFPKMIITGPTGVRGPMGYRGVPFPKMSSVGPMGSLAFPKDSRTGPTGIENKKGPSDSKSN